MSFTVYIKRGKKSYKELRLVNKLNSVINQRIKENPNFFNDYEPANNFAELQSLHDKICVEDVQFQEVQPKNNENMAKEIEEKEIDYTDFGNDDNSFIDPLNREEPVVRDYVMNEEFPSAEKIGKAKRTTFDEPVSFEESFELPSDDEQEQPTQRNERQQGGQRQQGNQRQQGGQRQQREPLNPSFDEMSNGKKKRSTKKMAKYLVTVACALAEKGFVWLANKDINESKLAEYEISGEIDLTLLLSMEDGQKITVRDFFVSQGMRAEELSKITEEEKSDLSETLAELMLEKGVAPTTTQEFLLITLGVFGGKALALWEIVSQNNAVLGQLKAIRVEIRQPQQMAQPTPTPRPQPVAEPIQQEARVEKVAEEPKTVLTEEYSYEESLILDKPINTIE